MVEMVMLNVGECFAVCTMSRQAKRPDEAK
jgi:hypothetical protein